MVTPSLFRKSVSALINASSRRGFGAFRRHDQLSAAAALQTHRDADGQGLDLGIDVLSHLLCGLKHGGIFLLSALARQLRDEATDPRGMQRDGDAVACDVDPLD